MYEIVNQHISYYDQVCVFTYETNHIRKFYFIFIFQGTYAGDDGSRKPSDLELKVAEHQGSHITQVATALKVGRAALPAKDANPPEPK